MRRIIESCVAGEDMTIWLNNPFDNLSEEGARAQRYAMLSAELVRRGHSVVWWTSDFSHVRKAHRDAASLASVSGAPLLMEIAGIQGKTHGWMNANGVEMRLIPTLPYRRNICFARIRSHARYATAWEDAALNGVKRGMLRRPDLVVVSLPPLDTGKTARRFRELWGCRVVVDIQDAWPAVFEQLLPFPSALSHAVCLVALCRGWRAARRSFAGSDGVMAVSEAYIDWARANGAKGQTAFGHLGIEMCECARAPSTASALRLAYIGNMGRSYDLATAINAIRSLVSEGHAVTLDLAGTGPDEQSLRALAGDCPAIRFHGQLDAAALSSLLSNCDAGLIPMFDRSMVALPNKLADYAVAGLAILETLSGETRSLVSRYDAGAWYPTGDIAACRNAVLALADDRERLAAFKSNSRKMAEEVFDSAKIYPRLCEWLEQFGVK